MWRGFGQTHVGHHRDNNEDSYLASNELGLYIVADGMGGHKGGEVASKLAVTTAAHHITSQKATLQQLSMGLCFPEVLTALAKEAILLACREIYRKGRSNRKLRGMGTTMTLLLCAGPWAALAHVGDSRLYRVRDTKVEQISEDHSLGAEMIRSGFFTEAELRHNHASHVLTRAVGTKRSTKVDVSLLRAEPGDLYLLCSDGLSGYLDSENHLASMMEIHDEDEDCLDYLIQHALFSGGMDNVTALVVRAADGPMTHTGEHQLAS